MLTVAVKSSWWQPVRISSFNCDSAYRMACQITLSGASVYYKSKASLFLHLPDFSLVSLSRNLFPTPTAIISNALPLNYFPYTSGFQLSSPLSPFSALSLALLGSGSFKKKNQGWSISLSEVSQTHCWTPRLRKPQADSSDLISSITTKTYQDLKSVVTASSHTCRGQDTHMLAPMITIPFLPKPSASFP